MMPTDEVPENDEVTGEDVIDEDATGVDDDFIPRDDTVVEHIKFEPCGNLAKPVVPLTGWVKYLGKSPETATHLRLYTDPCFEEWLEIPADIVVTALKGDTRESHDERSLIWVERDTMVTKWTVRTAKAGSFSRRELDSRGLDESSGETGTGHGAPPRPPTGHR